MKYLLLITPFLIFSCSTKKTYIQNGSYMENTIKSGDSYLLKKVKTFERSDIIVVEFKDEKSSNKISYTGRIFGLPGDEIVISKGELLVNGQQFELPKSAKFHYRMKLNDFNDRIKIDLDIQSKDMAGFYNCFISQEDSNKLFLKYKNVISSFQKGFMIELNQEILLNGNNKFGWDQDNFGPIKIPKTGDSISADFANVFMPANKIEEISAYPYESKKDYFFILCDNFHNGMDSRNFGIISSDQILGKIDIKNSN